MEVLGDYTPSVIKALSEIDKNWKKYEGLVICGSHNPTDYEYLISRIKEARENEIPFYGECYGHQLAAIEYARNVMGIKDATSEEFGEGTFVVKKLPELIVGLKNGESYWNNYEVDFPMFEIVKPKWFFTAQYHASYQSSKFKRHPLISNFLKYAKMAMQNSKKPRRWFRWNIL